MGELLADLPLVGEMSGRTEGVTTTDAIERRLPALHNPKPMPLIHRSGFQQVMPVLIAHMRNIDHRQRIGRLDSQNIARFQCREFLAASQNGKGAFKPPQIENYLGRVAHSLAQNFQNGFFSGASGAGAAE